MIALTNIFHHNPYVSKIQYLISGYINEFYIKWISYYNDSFDSSKLKIY